MNTSRRILYFAPDFSVPSGGIRTLYQHVDILRRHGYDAFIVHDKPNFHPGWFQLDVPALFLQKAPQLRDDDLLILPEDYQLPPTPHQRLIFCQNHFYIFRGLGQAKSWLELNVSTVLAASKPIAHFIKHRLAWPGDVPVIPYSIDPTRFRPASNKKFQVALMPRKRQYEAQFIYEFVRRQIPELTWAIIDQQPEDRAAEILAESALFLSLSRHEGFGLPPLEAMASACLVTGFHGFGGLDYATDQNGLWAPDDDLEQCALHLLSAARMIQSQDLSATTMLQAGLATASRYTKHAQTTAVLEVFSNL